jgi:hypothetical protein
LRKSERLLKKFFELFWHIGIAEQKNFCTGKKFNYNFGAIAQLAVFEKKTLRLCHKRAKVILLITETFFLRIDKIIKSSLKNELPHFVRTAQKSPYG